MGLADAVAALSVDTLHHHSTSWQMPKLLCCYCDEPAGQVRWFFFFYQVLMSTTCFAIQPLTLGILEWSCVCVCVCLYIYIYIYICQ